MLNPYILQSNLAEFQGWWIFMQIRQRIFKCFTMQICFLFFTAFWNFWCITRLSTTNHRWVINAQTGPVFWPTLYGLNVRESKIYTNWYFFDWSSDHSIAQRWHCVRRSCWSSNKGSTTLVLTDFSNTVRAVQCAIIATVRKNNK